MSRLFALSLSCVALSGCGGFLVVEDLDDPEGVFGCSSSSTCGASAVCVNGACEAADPCSVAEPNGACPRGRLCQSGICVLDSSTPDDPNDPDDPNNNNNNDSPQPVTVFDCSTCTEGQLCDGIGCVDPSDTDRLCSDTNLDGACTVGEVCVAGSCVPIVGGRNDCTPERPAGLCPPGGFCTAGVCFPIDEEPCSAAAPSGSCPAGQTCVGGSCSVANCSTPQAPFGACPDTQVCLNGVCGPAPGIFPCDQLDCVGQNREACREDANGFSVCGGCLDGFNDNGLGACVPDSCLLLDCAGQRRECDESVVPAACGACLDGFKESTLNVCAPVVCEDLACESENRRCDEGATVADPAACGDCVTGFVDAGGTCRRATCDDIGTSCAALLRGCIEGDGATTSARCGECEGSTEGADGLCATCNGPGLVPGACVACDVTADCLTVNGGPGGFCDADAKLCNVECTPDAPQSQTNTECGGGFRCSPNGRCAQVVPNGLNCAVGVQEGEIVEPIVAILVDQSGSMGAGFNINGRTIARWYAVEEVLFGGTNGSGSTPNVNREAANDPGGMGLITQFQNDIQFTVALYNTPVRFSDSSGDETTDLTEAIEPDFGIRDDLAGFFAGQVWTGGTQTANAIDVVDDYLRTIREERVVAGAAPPDLYIVLATDGEPDYGTCTDPNPSTIAEFLVLSEVEDARRDQSISLPSGETLVLDGVTTFSLSVGLDVSANHFQDVANVGAGLPSMTTLVTGVPNVGTLPSNIGALSGPDGADVAATDNLYFNAYSGPSELHTAALSSCGNDGDCPSGFECERNQCEPDFTATFCFGTCSEDSDDICTVDNNCSGGSNRCESSCPNDYDSCVEAFDGADPDGENRVDIRPDVRFPSGNQERQDCFSPRMTQCVSRKWPPRSQYGGAPGQRFESLSSNAACNGSNPCAAENEVCVDDQCVIAGCTPEGTVDEDGEQVMAPCFIGSNGAALIDALQGVFTEVTSCIVELNVLNQITENGRVFLDDDVIPEDQWESRGLRRIEILGEACETLRGRNPDAVGNRRFLSVEINTCIGEG